MNTKGLRSGLISACLMENARAISLDLDQYERSKVAYVFFVLFELRGRAMPTRTLCPKCHGQRIISCHL